MAPPRTLAPRPSHRDGGETSTEIRLLAGIGSSAMRRNRAVALAVDRTRLAGKASRALALYATLAAITTGALVSATGCSEPDRAVLVAVPGCGFEGGVLTALRVQTRGDFPDGGASQVVVDGGLALVAEDLGGVAAVTVEGLFGPSVSAVGRTARLRTTGEIPIYFAAVDRLCEAPGDDVLFRHPGGMAVAEVGDVVVVGGRQASGQLLDEILHVDDEQGIARVTAARLPRPATGQSVHAVGPRAFLVVGGASTGSTAASDVFRLDFDASGTLEVSARIPIEVPEQADHGRAYHAAAVMPDGSILVTGGCTAIVGQGDCVPTQTSVLGSSFRIILRDDDIEFERAPVLPTPRYEHALHIARDGVAFAVGGRGPATASVLAIDYLPPGEPRWASYGPVLTSLLPDTASIEGSALLDGGVLVLAVNDGTLWWVNAEAAGTFPGWCAPNDEDGPCFTGQRDGLRPPGPRPLVVLPGERIVADHYVLPVLGLGQTGADVLDLSLPAAGTDIFPPQQRTGASSVVLADGTLLMVGGLEVDPPPGAPLPSLTLRYRPALDGPDERIPGVDALAPGSLVGLQPDRIEGRTDGVRLSSAGTVVDFPTVRARVRGFRSRSFRFEATLSVVSGAYPHIVLEQGAVAGLSVRFGPDVVRGFFRNATGSVVDFSCGTLPEDFWDTSQLLQVTVRPDSFVVSQGDTTLVQCPAPQLDNPVAVGIGVSGSGSVTATALRLTRI